MTPSIFNVGERMKACIWGAAGDNVKMVSDKECKDNKNDEFYTEVKCSQVKGFDLNSKIMAKIDKNKFKLLHDGINKGELAAGVYRIELAGAQGGNGGGAKCWAGTKESGGNGGPGDLQHYTIILNKRSSFTASIGHIGAHGGFKDGACGTQTGGSGSSGGASTITIDGKTYTAAGGGGGAGGYATLYKMFGGCYGCHGGANGSPAGNGRNWGGGFVKILEYKF